MLKVIRKAKHSVRTRQCFIGAIAATMIAGTSHAATLAPLAAFGGGDGWRAPFEVLPGDAVGTDSIQPGVYSFLGNTVTNPAVNGGNLERGLAYNPVTGNLILISRNDAGGGPATLRILNGTTGVDLGFLDQGTGVISGGLFTRNMVGVADDGAIYMANLATTISASSPFKIYRWANESATPTVAYSGSAAADGVIAGARLGDTLDVIGSGLTTRLVAGYARNTAIAGTNGFSLFSTADGVNFTGQLISIGGSPTTDSGDFRLGITFTDADTVLGKQGDPNIPGVVDPSVVRMVDVAGSTGTLVTSFSTDGATLRAMDYAVVAGKPLLAILEASGAQDGLARSRVFIYDMTDPSLPIAERKIQEGSNLPIIDPVNGPNQFVNGNGVGSVKFGAISGNVATIYAMSTNNGIQAFQLTLDPPAVEDADFDGDDKVTGQDLMLWQQGVGITSGATPNQGDANGDGAVNSIDLDIWKAQYGTGGTPSAGAVPEPAAGLLMVAATVCGMISRAAMRRKTQAR